MPNNDIQDYERMQASLQLMNELAEGKASGNENGWLTLETVEDSLFAAIPTPK